LWIGSEEKRSPVYDNFGSSETNNVDPGITEQLLSEDIPELMNSKEIVEINEDERKKEIVIQKEESPNIISKEISWVETQISDIKNQVLSDLWPLMQNVSGLSWKYIYADEENSIKFSFSGVTRRSGIQSFTKVNIEKIDTLVSSDIYPIDFRLSWAADLTLVAGANKGLMQTNNVSLALSPQEGVMSAYNTSLKWAWFEAKSKEWFTNFTRLPLWGWGIQKVFSSYEVIDEGRRSADVEVTLTKPVVDTLNRYGFSFSVGLPITLEVKKWKDTWVLSDTNNAIIEKTSRGYEFTQQGESFDIRINEEELAYGIDELDVSCDTKQDSAYSCQATTDIESLTYDITSTWATLDSSSIIPSVNPEEFYYPTDVERYTR